MSDGQSEAHKHHRKIQARLKTHADLIDRINPGSGRDEQLCMEIICHLLAPEDAWVEQSKINAAWCIHKKDYKGRDRLWDWNSSRYENIRQNKDILRSLDACIGLMREVLPGWEWTKQRHDKVTVLRHRPFLVFDAEHPDLCRALLIAILQASDGGNGDERSELGKKILDAYATPESEGE